MENRKTFDQLLRDFENERKTADGRADGKALQTLSKAVALSVLAKVIDPCRKTGDKPQDVNGAKRTGTGQATPLLKARADVKKNLLDRTWRQAEESSKIGKNADGDPFTTFDKAEEKALSELLRQTCGDGFDLVQEAAGLLLEAEAEAEKRQGKPLPDGWMEATYTAKQIRRRVIIKDGAAEWEDIETSPIKEVYKGVRRLIGQSGGVTIDPRNKFIYVDDIATGSDADGAEVEQVIYRRYGKAADLGGYVRDYNGKDTVYTAGVATAAEVDELIEKLELGKRQKEYINRRLQGYGYKAIATAYNVSPQAVQNSMKLVQRKAEKAGFTPAAVYMAKAAADDEFAEVAADLLWSLIVDVLKK